MRHIVMHTEIRERIAQCVNACAGMDDPVAEVEKLRESALELLTGQIDTSKLKEAVDEARAAGFTTKTDCSDFNFATDACNSQSKMVLDKVGEKSWHDLGIFPPVGTVCEVTHDGMHGEWEQIEILKYDIDYSDGNDRGRVACISINGTVSVSPSRCRGELYWLFNPEEDDCKFRPIQTEKQKTIKEMLYCFDGFFNGDGDNAGQVCEKIYDQFIAEK